MRVEIVPCFKDNYAYLLVCDETGECAIVDASEEAPIVAAVRAHRLSPSAIWSTHHHPDHTGANEAVAKTLQIRTIVAYEGDRGRVPGQTVFAREGDELVLGRLRATVLHIPGHTTGAVAYYVTDGRERAVFTGDTMFVGGCGRLFEGTPEMMFGSFKKLCALPADTRVYCGHEYTEANLRFALEVVEPESASLATALLDAKAARAAGRPTIPSTLARELETNPFARARDASELGARRAQKDAFRG